MTEVKHGKFVMIGDFIAGAEEYAYEDPNRIHEKNGKLYASIPGLIAIDPLKRMVNVDNPDPNMKQTEINPGDIVVGQVDFIRKFTVGLRIYKVNNRTIFDGSIYGNVHISNISKRYIENVEEGYKKTDIVRAKVVEKWGSEYELSSDDPNLGVLSCDCTICGTKMKKSGPQNVECPFCGNKGLRKLASDFFSN